jgi:hypothetical protein
MKGFELLAGVQPVQKRHPDIDDDDVGRQFACGLEQGAAIGHPAHDIEPGVQ